MYCFRRKLVTSGVKVSGESDQSNFISNLEFNQADLDNITTSELGSNQSNLNRDNTKEISSESDSDTRSNQSSASTVSSRVSQVLKKSFKGKVVAIVKPFSRGVKKNTALVDSRSDEDGEARKSKLASSDLSQGPIKKFKNSKYSASRKLKFGTELKAVRVRLEKYNSKNFGQSSKSQGIPVDTESSTPSKRELHQLKVSEFTVDNPGVNSLKSTEPEETALQQPKGPTLVDAPESVTGNQPLPPRTPS